MSEKKMYGVSKKHFRRSVAGEHKKRVMIPKEMYIKLMNEYKNGIPSSSIDRSNLNNDIGSKRTVEQNILYFQDDDGESAPEIKIENICIPEYKSDGESISEYSESSNQFEQMNLSNSLYSWAQDHYISQEAFADLLKILKSPPCSSCLDLRKELDLIKNQQKEQTILLKKIGSKLFVDDGEKFNFEDILPAKIEEDILNLEDKLKNNEEFKLRFILYIQNIKGKQRITKIFKLFITDELANEYNWEGIKGKLKFKNFKIFNDCFFESVKHDISGYTNYIQEIKTALKDAKNRVLKKRFLERESLN